MSPPRWLLCALLCLAAAPLAAQSSAHSIAPDAVVTAEACGECHLSEFEVWKTTPHAAGFKTLHRADDAEAIARRMGHRLVKRDSPCLTCHYTTAIEGSRVRAVSGVSCESCHGAGRDWIEVHNNYGPGATFATESATHREQRVADSRAAGMLRPTDLYEVAANCFGCHTVPDERLVNVGGHTTGSTGFELVEWSQGAIRHNFLGAQRGGDATNAERSPERKRLMYVVGRSLELEYALRGLAVASEDGAYSKSMIRKVRNALAELGDIGERATLPAIGEMTAVVRAARIVPGQREALQNAADRVQAATRQLLRQPAGAQVAALDPLLLGLPEPVDTPEDTVAVAAEATTPTGASDAAPAVEAPVAEPSPRAAVTTVATGAVATQPDRPDYARRTRLRPRSSHRTIDAGACSGCHESENAWWFDDPHYAAAEPFHEGDPKNAQIARLYGLASGEATRGNQLCMDCHGTVVTGKERREVWDGVSCQSCHGGAADYLEPHKEGEAADGERRSGYVAALDLGMAELRDAGVRAANCASCHYITDPRLISSGHPTGADFDIADRMPHIRHWEGDDTLGATLTAAFREVVRQRGAVPSVQVASLPASAPTTAPGDSSTATATGGSPNRVARQAPTRARPVRTLPPRQRPIDPISIPDPDSVVPLDLPPFPELAPELPVEELLGILQQRLALLYDRVREE